MESPPKPCVHPPAMVGDCDRCGHSIAYHAPFIGCVKCSCGEFK